MSIEEKLNEYLPAVDISATLRSRIASIYQEMVQICPDSIQDIFISESLTPEGTRNYGSVFFFSQLFIMEAKQFLAQDCFDITPLKKRVYYYELRCINYDFERATDNSRLIVTVKFGAGISANLQASKINCNFLKNIIQSHLKTNLL